MAHADPKDKVAYNRAYYLANREKLLSRQKEYAMTHREDRNIYQSRRREANRQAIRESHKAWRDANPDKTAAYSKKWANNNRAQATAIRKAWEVSHREHINAKRRERMNTNENARLRHNIKSRIREALKANNGKSASTAALLGCSISELWVYLEAQFQPGMTRANHGEWHIDHIRPCASFDLTDPAQRLKCFHYTNVQPLWAEDNIRKGAAWLDEVEYAQAA